MAHADHVLMDGREIGYFSGIYGYAFHEFLSLVVQTSEPLTSGPKSSSIGWTTAIKKHSSYRHTFSLSRPADPHTPAAPAGSDHVLLSERLKRDAVEVSSQLLIGRGSASCFSSRAANARSRCSTVTSRLLRFLRVVSG